MDKLSAFLTSALTAVSGWSGLLQLASYAMEAAAELAQKEGMDPDEFDRRVCELEAARRESFASLVGRWKAILR